MLDPDAVKLAKKLDGLSLALATAGAYLDQVAISFSDYLRLYKESWVKLQKTSPDLCSLYRPNATSPYFLTSKRSKSMTLAQAATKSATI